MLKSDYEFFEGAKKIKVPNVFLAILMTIVFLFVAEYGGGFIASLIEPLVKDNPTLLKLTGLICNGGIFIILIVLAKVKFGEKRSISTIGLGRKNILLKYLVGLVIGFIMFSTVVLILKTTGHITVNPSGKFPSGIAALASVLIVLPGWAIQSAGEEVLTRGWLMNVLGGRYSAAVAVGVSASIFGILHLLNPSVSIIALINIILVGVFFGIYILKTNDLWGACGIHCAWNWSQGNVYGFEVSGTNVGMSTLMNLKLTGAEWFTGGSFGPEAGLVATIVVSIAIIIVLKYFSNKNNKY